MKMFTKLNFEEKFDYDFIYPTTHDAILHICHRSNAITSSMNSPIYQKRLHQHYCSHGRQLNECGQENAPVDISLAEIDFIDEIDTTKVNFWCRLVLYAVLILFRSESRSIFSVFPSVPENCEYLFFFSFFLRKLNSKSSELLFWFFKSSIDQFLPILY